MVLSDWEARKVSLEELPGGGAVGPLRRGWQAQCVGTECPGRLCSRQEAGGSQVGREVKAEELRAETARCPWATLYGLRTMAQCSEQSVCVGRWGMWSRAEP